MYDLYLTSKHLYIRRIQLSYITSTNVNCSLRQESQNTLNHQLTYKSRLELVFFANITTLTEKQIPWTHTEIKQMQWWQWICLIECNYVIDWMTKKEFRFLGA